MKFLTITYATISLLFLYGAFAQRVFSNPATPEPEIVLFPSLLITEADFKNSEHDTIIIEVLDDMNDGKGNTLKGLSFKDDSVFFEISQELYIRSNEKIIISFKHEVEEINTINEGLTINLTKSGLTGTTEQFIMLNGNQKVVDAVCWTNSKPTETEINDLEDLFNEGGWNSSDITSCVNSDEISKDQIIQRKNLNDTDNKDDWEIKIEETLIEKTDKPEIVEIEEYENSERELEICEGEIIISEVLPNPSGKDSNREWIEIMNSSGAACSLYGWEIDDQEGGSKAYAISSTELIPPGKYLLLPSWKTKLNLNNTEDSVRLFNQDGKLVDEINYENSPENQSYALDSETDNFSWTTQLTPLVQNVFPKEEEMKEKKSDKEAAASEESKIANGTLANQIYITEVFPNPKGQDKGLEWIEIFNDSSDLVKLGNWTLETSSKTYTFKNISLEAKDYLTLSDVDLGFSLRNSDEKLILKDFNDNKISSVNYDDVSEAKSFMEITNIENETSIKHWIWTKDPTPGEENHTTYTYIGVISDFNEINGKLTLLTNKESSDEEKLEILVLLSGDELTDSIFNIGAQVKVVVKQENNNWVLENYTLLKEAVDNNPETNSNNLLYILISSLPPLGFLGYSTIKKFGLIKIV